MLALSPPGLRLAQKHSLKNHKLTRRSRTPKRSRTNRAEPDRTSATAFLAVISSWALRRTKIMLTHSSEHPSVPPRLPSYGKAFGSREVFPPRRICRRWEGWGNTDVLFTPCCPQFRRLSPPQEHVHRSYLVTAAHVLVRSRDKQESMDLL